MSEVERRRLKRAQSHLTRTADAAAELGLVISAPKTEFMTIHCHPQQVTFFNITCITVLLHGCESWVIPKDMENRINSFGTSRYRMMIGHALRLPENEPVTDFVMYVPLHGRKKPGRQRPLFTNYIHCLLGILIIC